MAAGTFSDADYPSGTFDGSVGEGAWFDDMLGHELSATIIPPYGPTAFALLLLALEQGTKVIFEWATDVMKAMSGGEQRVSLIESPKMRFEGSTLLIDDELTGDRVIRTLLVGGAPTGQPYWLAIPHEELTVAQDATTGVIFVNTTANCDWANPGQNVALVGLDGVSLSYAVVQSKIANAVIVSPAPSAASSKRGSSIVPLITVLLEAQQGLGRYAVNVTDWGVKARALLFGYAGLDTFGTGATLNSFVSMTGDEIPVFDYGLGVTGGPTQESMQSLIDMLDLGAVPRAMHYTPTMADWGREIRVNSGSVAVYQWLKLFLCTVRGRFRHFWLPTWRPDLVYDSTPISNTLKVKSGEVLGSGDYMTWFNNTEHKYLQVLKTDGTIQYTGVTDAGDNFDGTITLETTANITGTPEMISFLELVRLDSDIVEFEWSGHVFSTSLIARVVQP